MLVCLSALSKAQQGRVGINTTTPAATLDVVATTTDNARPDALLVPRMTRAQLLAKDAAYTAAQNGALAFITTIDGTATAKTTNVTAVGFYYYDGQTTNTWIAVGGTTAVAPVSVKNLSATYTILPTDDILLFSNTANVTLTLPATGFPVGKRIYVSAGGTADINLSPAPRENALVNIFSTFSATLMYTGDSINPWSVVSGL
ncbi:hypothetical protein [Chryseobacterium sp. Mn2064]|uniref:hypothetical protein n=1 Tax=Chryseobacterium sp. Mn2064 TaxID=3395263 RepID=UPI003BECB11E